ncbi:outer membrane beta-barrel protein [Pseudochryseolinea flava]|uniref:Outer membrane protein beta-barrel domain-containing protein n=1 Tax=Pseudochryseolinea flava TaxID=2059302 RepID=A0A364XYC8_9BACT|nr:outer membrane beta-barrel protein [Pseudochryseolinea flava]RAV98802.1 hypothetical protein DQQ10_22565 [Pseudochryseolinea flava]
MKNKIFWMTIVIMMSTISLTVAQLKRVDVFVGPGLMSIRSEIPIDLYDPKIGIGGGISASYGISDDLSLNAQLLYERKGAQEKVAFRDNNNISLGEGTIYTRLNSISIPVTLGYEFGGSVRMQVAGGFFVSSLITQKTVTKNGHGESFNGDGNPNFKSFDFGATIVYTLYIPVSDKCDIRIGLQDNFGLKDLSKGNWSFRTNALNLFVGTSFKF